MLLNEGAPIPHSAPARRSPTATLVVLAIAAMSYVLQQTLVVPALPDIQRDLHTSNTWVAWVFTGFLLTSAIFTPIIGKLGDMFGKKRLLVVAMGMFAIGTIVAALAQSITVLIIARAIQGIGGAIFPLSFGIIRDELPADRVGPGLGLLSATFGVGGGLGLVLSGIILQHGSWSSLFWVGLIPGVIALVAVAVLIPESPIRTPARIDWFGALTLSGALGALLIALSEGAKWHWLSPLTLGVFALALLFSVLWVVVELHVKEPLIDIGLMRDPSVFWTNFVALLAGVAMFSTFLLIPMLVESPRGLPPAVGAQLHYGFNATVVQAGLYLLPSSVVMFIVGPLAGMLEARVGARLLLTIGLSILACGALALVVAHESKLGIVIAMGLVGGGVGTSYSMLAKLIVDSVPREVTGVAMGMNTVMRTIGGVIGGQIGAAVLASVTLAPPFPPIPTIDGFVAMFSVAAGIALLGAIFATRIPKTTHHYKEVTAQ